MTTPTAAPTAGTSMPDPLALDHLFPPIVTAPPTTSAEPPAPVAPGEPPAGVAAPEFGRVSQSRAPVLAGLAVTLVILIFGGGFLWWRDRDRHYWPA